MVNRSDYVKIHGVRIYTNIGLWPFSSDEIRLWSGSVRLDATDADGDHWYKVRCSCHKIHMPLFRCTHGTGKVKKGEVKYLSLKVPEPAINTAIMTVFIDKTSVDLCLYKLDGAEELYFGTGATDKLTTLIRSPTRLKWDCRDEDRAAFEVVSTMIKPLFENLPQRLTDYLMESNSHSTTWQRLNEMVYPVVLELLQDLGEFAKRESRKGRFHRKAVLSKPVVSRSIANEMAELVLLRLSEKLRRQFGASSDPVNCG